MGLIKKLSFLNDLINQLVEYLLYCAGELGLRNKFILRIDQPVSQKFESVENDVVFSIKKNFEYEVVRCRLEINSAMTRLVVHVARAVRAI